MQETGLGTETTRAPRLPIVGAEREEILRHKWIESEKAGHDLGESAIRDWAHSSGNRLATNGIAVNSSLSPAVTRLNIARAWRASGALGPGAKRHVKLVALATPRMRCLDPP